MTRSLLLPFKNSPLPATILPSMRTTLLLVALLLSPLAVQAAEDGCARFSPAIERAVAISGVPGVAIAVVMGLLSAPLDRVRGDTFLVQWLPGDAPERVVFGANGLTKDDVAFTKEP